VEGAERDRAFGRDEIGQLNLAPSDGFARVGIRQLAGASQPTRRRAVTKGRRPSNRDPMIYDNASMSRFASRRSAVPNPSVKRSHTEESSSRAPGVNTLVRPNGRPWMISDIYLDGAVSEVATRRTECAFLLETGGIGRRLSTALSAKSSF
jgi:hypothetical protein